MGPLRLLLLAATGGVGLAACVPVSSVVCNGFPTGNPAAVNSSATQFRLDETESMQPVHALHAVTSSLVQFGVVSTLVRC